MTKQHQKKLGIISRQALNFSENGTKTVAGGRKYTMNFASVAIDYLNVIKTERQLAQKTCETYAAWIRRYQRWLDDNGHEDATVDVAFAKETIKTYSYQLRAGKLSASKRPIAAATVWSSMCPLVQLGEYLLRYGILDENTARTAVEMPKKRIPPPPNVKDSEIAALLDAPTRELDPSRAAFYSALLHTLIYTGLRANELVTLETQDIDLEGKKLIIRKGKGGKVRVLYPAPEFFTAMEAWLNYRAKMKIEENDPKWPERKRVWMWTRCKWISDDFMRMRLEHLKCVAGLRDAHHIKPHALRHWFATNMDGQGFQTTAIQASLGHSQLSTTMRYIRKKDDAALPMAFMTAPKPRPLGESEPPRPELVRQTLPPKSLAACRATLEAAAKPKFKKTLLRR